MASMYHSGGPGPGRPPVPAQPPFASQPSFRPNQSQLPPPPQPMQGKQYHHGFGGSQQPMTPHSHPANYNQTRSNSNLHHGYHFGPSQNQQLPPSRSQQQQQQHHRHNQLHPQKQQQQQQQYPFPSSSSSYGLPSNRTHMPSINSQSLLPPAPPPQQAQTHQQHSQYYPSSQYSQFLSQAHPPPSHDRPPSPPLPPPPSSPPPNSSFPPPPPPVPPPTLLPPPPPPSSHPNSSIQPNSALIPKGPLHGDGRIVSKDSKPVLPSKPKFSAPPSAPGRAPHVPNGPPIAGARVETEEDRKLRKKKEYEKRKQEEKQQQLKESQNTVLQKTHLLSYAGPKPHGSLTESRAMDRRTPFLGAERIDNRLKKPTTFLCKLKFRNELPDPTAQPKLLTVNTNKDRYAKYTVTSLEKMHKPKLFVEPDLGIPLDLLDISVYNAPNIRPPLAPEDEELLRDGDVATPVKQEGIRIKERPTDKGVSWLVKTQYISPLSLDSAKQVITEKQAKELRETREGRKLFLENLNNREKQIQAIEESFKASKLHPVHQTKPGLEPVEILPLLPDFDRYDDRFVMVAFDGDPTNDSEIYNKLDRDVRNIYESRAIMKSFVFTGSDPSKPEKFLAYMAPGPEEITKDIYDENEDTLYSWVREYHWDVRGDDADDPTTYLVNFDEETARYLPLPTKLVLQKKRAKEGRSTEEGETHYPVPSRVTVRRRSVVAALDQKDSGRTTSTHYYGSSSKGEISSSKRGRSPIEDDHERLHKVARTQDMDRYSEEDMSD